MCLDAICGGDNIYLFDEDTHILTSPGYPNAYPSNLNCTWHIAAYEGYLIRIHVEYSISKIRPCRDYFLVSNLYNIS